MEDERHLQDVLDAASGQKQALIYGHDARGLLRTHDVYLGFVDGNAVGCVMASATDDSLVIHNLAVAESHRNRGHATTLVKAAIAFSAADGCSAYWAAVDPANPSAIKRFHLLGFVPYESDVGDMIIMMRQAGPTAPMPSHRRHAVDDVQAAAVVSRMPQNAAAPGSASNDRS